MFRQLILVNKFPSGPNNSLLSLAGFVSRPKGVTYLVLFTLCELNCKCAICKEAVFNTEVAIFGY